MIQSFGRARAIRRDTLEKALKAGIFNDVVLDLTVNSVRHWEAPNEVVEPLALDGLVPTSPWDMVAGWPHIWKTIESAKHTWKKVHAAARAGTPGVFSSVNILLEKTHGVPIDAVRYRRGGPKQNNRWAFLDQTVVDAGKQIVEKIGGALAAVSRFRMLWPRQIKPLAGNGKVKINENRVWTLVRETLDQLFDRAAKNPWRRLPDNRPTQFICEPCDPDEAPAPHVCPAGQLGRMIYKSVEQRKREGTYCVWPLPKAKPQQVEVILDLHEAANDKS